MPPNSAGTPRRPEWLHHGESLGLPLSVKMYRRRRARALLGHFVSEELADGLDRHYHYDSRGA